MVQRWISGLAVAAIFCSGCGSSSDSTLPSQNPATSTTSGTSGSTVAASKILEDLRQLAIHISRDNGSNNSVLARASSDRQIQTTIPGPAGGSATLSGEFAVGADADHVVNSTLAVTFTNLKFFDGLVVDGGTVQLTTSLWGSEAAAHGKIVLDAQGVDFSGTSSGTHSFKVELQVVNSKVIDTVVTFDGQRREFGVVVKLVNHSTTPDDHVFVTLIGKDPAQRAWYYLAKPTDAAMTEFEDTPGAFLPKAANGAFIGSEKYSMALSEMTPLADHTRVIVIPRDNIVSGRIFFSFGQKLQGIGVNCPYYSRTGQPITQPATATSNLQVDSEGRITLTGLDATQVLGLNEPVTYRVGSGPIVSAIISDVVSATQIKLNPPPAASANNTQLTFTPDPQALSSAKLALSGPSPTGPPDYLTTFDLMELSVTTNPTAPDPFYTLFANTTAIDFFSVGLGMTVDFAGLAPTGEQAAVAPSEKSVGFATTVTDLKNGVSQRSKIFDRFNNIGDATPSTPPEFQNFVTAEADPAPETGVNPHLTLGKPVDGARTIIRVLGPPPVVAVQPQGPLSTYLDSVITQQWGPFCQAAQNLTGANAILFPLVNPSFRFEGTTPSSAATLNMKCTQAPGGVDPSDVFTLPKPTTRIVFECDDTQNPAALPNNYTNSGTDAHRRLCSILLAAFARGVFPNTADWSNHSKFYGDANKKYNFFSKVMHEFALDGVVYGFAYDDVYGQDSTISGPINLTNGGKIPTSNLGNVVDVTLTIPNFTAPPPAPPPPVIGAPVTVQAILNLDKDPASPEGCLAHFTTADGKIDVNAPLNSSGIAVVRGLNANVPYTAWISPAGPNANKWTYSYAAVGKYDGTTGGNWNSSFSSNAAGVVKIQFGQLVPGVGSKLDPQPESPRGPLPPLVTPNSRQGNWGN